MTARTEWRGLQFQSQVEHGITMALARVGERGKAVTQQHTPVRTGTLRRSEHYVVVDKDGSVLAGETMDENGNDVPAYSGNGQLRVIVGTNEAEDVGYSYALFVEVGTAGRPGHGMLAAGRQEMEAAVKDELRGVLP